jgi:hypothetical protein
MQSRLSFRHLSDLPLYLNDIFTLSRLIGMVTGAPDEDKVLHEKPRPANEDNQGQFSFFSYTLFFLTFLLLIGVLSILDAATNDLVLSSTPNTRFDASSIFSLPS